MIRRAKLAMIAVLVGGSVLVGLHGAAEAATLDVTTTVDGGPGSLRDAFEQATDNTSDDVINLQAGATYEICAPLVHSDHGFTLLVNGNGATIRQTCNEVAISHGGSNTLRLVGLTITGKPGGSFGAIKSTGGGAELELDEVVLTDNHTLGEGAAIWANGKVQITDSVITGNTAGAHGGAIHTQPPYPATGNTLEVTETVIRDNVAQRGGGIDAVAALGEEPRLSIALSDISDNTANGVSIGQGAGVYASGPVTMVWTTISGNRSAGIGSGLYTSGELFVLASTVSGNVGFGTSPHGGHGIFAAGTGDAEITSSTLVGNAGTNLTVDGATFEALANVIGDPVPTNAGLAQNCSIDPATTSQGYNVEDDDTCGFGAGPGDRVDVAELGLRPLADNGAVGPTHHPTWSGGLIDVIPGGAPLCPTPFGFDQRLGTRPEGSGCDVGAIEFSPEMVPDHLFTDVPPWVQEAVSWISFYEYATGYSDSTFRPDETSTRAQVVRMLYRLAGEPDVSTLPPHGLSDVPAWVQDAVRWAAHDPDGAGPLSPVMAGFPDDTFRPDDTITRAQFIRALYRLAGEPDVSALPPHGFSDVPPWVQDAVRWAAHDPDGGGALESIMAGFPDNTFRPDDSITRAQITRALFRFDQRR